MLLPGSRGSSLFRRPSEFTVQRAHVHFPKNVLQINCIRLSWGLGKRHLSCRSHGEGQKQVEAPLFLVRFHEHVPRTGFDIRKKRCMNGLDRVSAGPSQVPDRSGHVHPVERWEFPSQLRRIGATYGDGKYECANKYL